MYLVSKFLRIIDKFFPVDKVYAHCDIPCGIYDPHNAQVAAHTVIRMMSLIKDAKGDAHDIARYTKVKEDHAELVKHEVRVIWGDYFKPEHIEKKPELHELVFNIMKLGSKSRQGTDIKEAEELLAKVQEFAEIFWKSKNIETVRVKAPYPTGGEMVLHR